MHVTYIIICADRARNKRFCGERIQKSKRFTVKIKEKVKKNRAKDCSYDLYRRCVSPLGANILLSFQTGTASTHFYLSLRERLYLGRVSVTHPAISGMYPMSESFPDAMACRARVKIPVDSLFKCIRLVFFLLSLSLSFSYTHILTYFPSFSLFFKRSACLTMQFSRDT